MFPQNTYMYYNTNLLLYYPQNTFNSTNLIYIAPKTLRTPQKYTNITLKHL